VRLGDLEQGDALLLAFFEESEVVLGEAANRAFAIADDDVHLHKVSIDTNDRRLLTGRYRRDKKTRGDTASRDADKALSHAAP
jgi:hypothetical protein